jgi:hypothetical protein
LLDSVLLPRLTALAQAILTCLAKLRAERSTA